MTDKAPERIWPDKIRIRDTGFYDDLGGAGQRIYTTAGQGYEKREYVPATALEAAQARIAELTKQLDHAWEKVGEADTRVCQNIAQSIADKRAIATARAEALEEAAVKAEREGVYPELNVWDGGPDWYKHGKRIAAAIRALKEKPNG